MRPAEAVEVCLPAPSLNARQVRLSPGWTILETTVRYCQPCSATLRVAWLTMVLALESETARAISPVQSPWLRSTGWPGSVQTVRSLLRSGVGHLRGGGQ